MTLRETIEQTLESTDLMVPQEIAEACVKAGVRKDPEDDEKRITTTKYAKVYLDRRAHTAYTHPEWTPGHSHNDAMRIVSKELLKDMWVASKALHTGEDKEN